MDLVLLAGETDSIETIHPMDLKEDGSWTVEFPEKATGNHTALQSRIMIMKTQAKAPRENFSILMPWQRLEERARGLP